MMRSTMNAALHMIFTLAEFSLAQSRFERTIHTRSNDPFV